MHSTKKIFKKHKYILLYIYPTCTYPTNPIHLVNAESVKVVASTPRTATNVTKGFELPQRDLKFSVTPRSQSPASGRATPVIVVATSDSADEGKIGKARDAKFDPQQLYKKERGEEKEQLYMVVVGHVDAGKSTLMGRLLCEMGQVGFYSYNFYV